MKLAKVAVLPIGTKDRTMQSDLNRMIEELFIEGWEFDRIIVADHQTIVIFAKEKQNKIIEAIQDGNTN